MSSSTTPESHANNTLDFSMIATPGGKRLARVMVNNETASYASESSSHFATPFTNMLRGVVSSTPGILTSATEAAMTSKYNSKRQDNEKNNNNDDEDEECTAITFAKSAPHSGYLKKLGKNIHSFKRRFFVLKPSTHLYYFMSPNDVEPRGCIDLDNFVEGSGGGCQVNEIGVLPDGTFRFELVFDEEEQDLNDALLNDGDDNVFETKSSNNRQSIVLEARTEEIGREWISKIKSERLSVAKGQVDQLQTSLTKSEAACAHWEESASNEKRRANEAEMSRNVAIAEAKSWEGRFRDLNEAIQLLVRDTTSTSEAEVDSGESSSSSEFLRESLQGLELNGTNFDEVSESFQRIRDDYNEARKEKEYANESIIKLQQRLDEAEERATKAEADLAQVQEDARAMQNDLKRVKREKKILVKEVKTLHENRRQQEIENKNLKQRQSEQYNSNSPSIRSNEDQRRLILELEEHVMSGLRLSEQFLHLNGIDPSEVGDDFGSSIQTSKASDLSPLRRQRIPAVIRAKPEILGDDLDSIQASSKASDMSPLRQMQNKPNVPLQTILSPANPSLQRNHQMSNLLDDDDDDEEEAGEEEVEPSESEVTSRSEQGEASQTEMHSGDEKSVKQNLNEIFAEEPHTDTFEQAAIQASKQNDTTNDASRSLAEVASIQSSESVRSKVTDNGHATTQLVKAPQDARSEPSSTTPTDGDGGVYHITFYRKRLGLQFQKVPNEMGTTTGLLSNVLMTADGLDAPETTATELQRIASLSQHSKKRGGNSEMESILPVSPVDAVIVCGLLGLMAQVEASARKLVLDLLPLTAFQWKSDDILKKALGDISAAAPPPQSIPTNPQQPSAASAAASANSDVKFVGTKRPRPTNKNSYRAPSFPDQMNNFNNGHSIMNNPMSNAGGFMDRLTSMLGFGGGTGMNVLNRGNVGGMGMGFNPSADLSRYGPIPGVNDQPSSNNSKQKKAKSTSKPKEEETTAMMKGKAMEQPQGFDAIDMYYPRLKANDRTSILHNLLSKCTTSGKSKKFVHDFRVKYEKANPKSTLWSLAKALSEEITRLEGESKMPSKKKLKSEEDDNHHKENKPNVGCIISNDDRFSQEANSTHWFVADIHTTNKQGGGGSAWARPLNNSRGGGRFGGSGSGGGASGRAPPGMEGGRDTNNNGGRNNNTWRAAGGRSNQSQTPNNNNNNNGNRSRPSPPAGGASIATQSPPLLAESNEQNESNVLRERFLHLCISMIGQTVTLTQTNGLVLEGIFHTFAPFENQPTEVKNVYVIQACRMVKPPTDASEGTFENGATVLVPAAKVASVHVKSMRLDAANAAEKGVGPSGTSEDMFQTDSQISGGKGGSDNLVAAGSEWISAGDGGDALEGPSSSRGGSEAMNWRSKKSPASGEFGVKTSFDENLYTTKLDKDKIDQAKLKHAERIAREIEGQATTNIHLAEERNQKLALDFDEEDLYSGVLDKSGKDKAAREEEARKKAAAPTTSWAKLAAGKGAAAAAAPAEKPKAAAVTPDISELKLNFDDEDTGAQEDSKSAAEKKEEGNKEEDREEGKPKSTKLNANAKAFSFNPGAKTFTPSAPTAPAPTHVPGHMMGGPQFVPGGPPMQGFHPQMGQQMMPGQVPYQRMFAPGMPPGGGMRGPPGPYYPGGPPYPGGGYPPHGGPDDDYHRRNSGGRGRGGKKKNFDRRYSGGRGGRGGYHHNNGYEGGRSGDPSPNNEVEANADMKPTDGAPAENNPSAAVQGGGT
ncbi:ataxin-2-like protein [Skeletonema marinoi]|uniref:Ataxin-2-like protein n=1 Tax=Skeletonema marinoi TaxID=267567 RepID=A0AAD9DH18_9STRA|nr:ataxin-2-like protein [Skeletonema marinoi]